MITCPWCGTNYLEFQSNCENCGGSLPMPSKETPQELTHKRVTGLQDEEISPPPFPPRTVPPNYKWRVLATDSLAIVSGVFALLGVIFGPLGIALTLGVITAFVGIPFALLGVVFLGFSLPVFYQRYQNASATVEILKTGQAALGQIESVRQNFNIRINHRYPWNIQYSFQVLGSDYEGKVTTLSAPGMAQQPGKPVYVLYAPSNPEANTLYPNPYGYRSVKN